MNDSKSDHNTLWDLIKDIRFGMLTHRHNDGMLYSHPLTTQNKSLDQASVLYFFIFEKSELANGLRQDGNVNVSYASPDDDRYVSIAGVARVTHDPAKVEQLWSPAAQDWFPDGPTDPDLALLAVEIRHAEYWDVEESRMKQLFNMAKAALTGEQTPHPSGHKEVNMT
ncbi:MAG: pyridoxamine 5'-phosphate oxidase family protein [Sulfuriferula multivorans]|uniref:Pyridoxamine 5'-phosphate oxidase family protein n=1 Tax=Sulfuriferula multivorans TaxID=1559896 RepID=A0A7C9TAI8_9PROT|nr:pyridoxamine 5'-phosphate oxidase family protein [Sulfuriferula multivorans]